MSLFFLHPIYLYGLIATSLPIVIHLLNRRRLKRVRFPAVRFILLSQRRISRSYKLRHWLILALRTCAVFFLALLLAHPIFQTGAGLLAGGGPLSLIVILDNSLSMAWSREDQGFKEAKAAVRRIISSLKDGDRAAILPAYGPARRKAYLRGERELLLRHLDEIQVSSGTGDFSGALREAYGLLLKDPAAQKQIWILSDLALTDWDRFDLTALGQYDPLIPLKIIKVGSKDERLNATVKEIRMRGSGVGVGMPIHIEAVLSNFSGREIRDLLVELRIDERSRDQKLVSLPPKAETVVSFVFQIGQAGDHSGRVTLKKEGLAGNPAANFVLQAQDKIKLLVVDGDPQTSLVQSETFFLLKALNPDGEKNSSLFLATVAIPEALSAIPLENYQALLLCNVSAIPEAILPKLRDYLLSGGGLLFFFGDRVQIENYNLKLFQSAPPILPARIRDKRLLPESAGEKIAKVEFTHPALHGLADATIKESLQSTRIQGYVRADLPDGSSLLTLANGDPLLFEKKLGSGRALFFTTAADRDWSDLPLKTAYLPLLQSLVSYIAGGRKGAIDTGISVGSFKTISLPPSLVGKSLRITMPDRKDREVPIIADGEKVAARFEENDLAGIYQLSFTTSAEGKDLPRSYAANPPFLESRLETIGELDLQDRLKPIRTEVFSLESLDKGGRRIDLSFPLLLLLIATLTAEGWLAQRFYA